MKTTINQAAIIISISLFVMTLAAIFAFGYAHSTLFDLTSPEQTLENLSESKSLFNLEILAWGIIILTDLAVSYGLYIYMKPIHEKGALASGVLRLIYTTLLAYAVLQLFQISTYVSIDGTQILVHEAQFHKIWFVGLIVFGIHLMVTGLVFWKSKHFPAWLSGLLVFAGVSYATIHGLYVLFPQVDSFTKIAESLLSAPMMLSELSLAFWLIVKGRKLNGTHLAIRR